MRAVLFGAALLGCLGCSEVSGLDDFIVGNADGGQGGGGGGPAPGGGGGGVGGAGGEAFVMLELPIASSEHDAWDDEQLGDLSVCRISDIDYRDACGLQWQLPIAPGAMIESAQLSVRSQAHFGAMGAYDVEVRLEDRLSPAAWSGQPNDIKTRSFWSNAVMWSIPDGGLPVDAWIDTPPLTELIQHAVNRSGWQSGGTISIAMWGVTSAGSSADDLVDYSFDPQRAAILRIAYRP